MNGKKCPTSLISSHDFAWFRLWNKVFSENAFERSKTVFNLLTHNFWTMPEFFAIMRIFLHNIFQTSLYDLRMRFDSICCTIFFPVSLSELIYHKWLKIQSQLYQNSMNYNYKVLISIIPEHNQTTNHCGKTFFHSIYQKIKLLCQS